MADESPRFRDALEVLSRHGVELIVVGGVAAVLNGAPISTFDLDIVHSRAAGNIDRLMRALAEIDKVGPVDVLGTIGAGHGYEDLMKESEELSLGDSRIRILSLPALIRVKEEVAHEKDRAVLAILRRTLAEKGRT